MQMIVCQLIFQDQPVPAPSEISPWIDHRLTPIDEIFTKLEAQRHRRFIKTHLPLDGLPFYPQVRYIVVGRDPRDVFMSLWNHYSNYADGFYARVNAGPRRVGPTLPRCPRDIHELWSQWITQGWFEWESEGYPFWGNMHHTQTWWRFRRLENILFVHFNDLLADLEGEIRRIARFLGIGVSEVAVSTIAHATSFSTVKQNVDRANPSAHEIWEGGAATFFFKGTNGRWRDVLSAEELVLYEIAVTRVLTPDCARWLEQSRAALAWVIR
jgi:aryl sulfotransferase